MMGLWRRTLLHPPRTTFSSLLLSRESSTSTSTSTTSTPALARLEPLQMRHPWREWFAFVHLLFRHGYFRNILEWGGDQGANVCEYLPFVKHAVRKFGRDRPDILMFLSKEEISTVVRFGCPALDKRTVNACKRLRLFCLIPEGTVCKGCRLKTACRRAYAVPAEHLQTGTNDVTEVAFHYAMNAVPITQSFQPPKEVEDAVLSILKQVVRYGSQPKVDATLSPDVALVTRLPKPVVADIRLKEKYLKKHKKWACVNCKFINFIQDRLCRACTSLRPRKSDPGDWECDNPRCRFVNKPSNIVCLRCKIERSTPVEVLNSLGYSESRHDDYEAKSQQLSMHHTSRPESEYQKQQNAFTDDDSNFEIRHWSQKESEAEKKSAHKVKLEKVDETDDDQGTDYR